VALSRRDFLLLSLGAGGGVLATKWLSGRSIAAPRPARAAGSPRAAQDSAYGAMTAPPDELGGTALDDLTFPPPASRGPKQFDLAVQEQPVMVGRGRTMAAWTFNGRIPGPVIRATEGDEITIRFRNQGAHPHNLHFHGAHALASDGWEPVPPGGTVERRFRAEPAGLHPYHCDMTPAPEHISHGLYGVMLVDPLHGRAPAKEFVLTLGGFDTDGDGKSDLYGWNGVAGYYMKYPLKVPAGELVRVYLTNMLGDLPVISFHLHATVFDVYRSGTGRRPDERTDVVTLAQAERALLEFRLPERGRYMFHPHQAGLAERGAMGWFAAI
jgi:FtsP/CotA-like multicopper oxidase with cupredoxin domain